MNIVLENGLDLAGFQLDFDRVQELAKEQARYDEEYDKAMQAWHEIEAEKYRRYVAQESAKAQAHAASEATPAGSCDCYALPSCAIPPPKEYVKSPPPKQRSVGLDEIPIVIRANARLNVGGMQYGKSQVRREFIPKERAKQPCCPKCGIPGCVDRCDGCGYILPAQPHLPEPIQVPPAEVYRPLEDPGQAPLLHQTGSARTGYEEVPAVSPLRHAVMETLDRPVNGLANLQEPRVELPFQSASSGATWLNSITD